jgi:hypothetical protein
MSNDLYNKLKFVAQVLLPALGTLYFTLAGIWDLPKAEEVVGTIVAVDAFLGVILHISTERYNKELTVGTIHVSQLDSGGKSFTLDVGDADPEKIDEKEELRFKVENPEKKPTRKPARKRKPPKKDDRG